MSPYAEDSISSLLLHQADALILYTISFTAFYLPFLTSNRKHNKFEINLNANKCSEEKAESCLMRLSPLRPDIIIIPVSPIPLSLTLSWTSL